MPEENYTSSRYHGRRVQGAWHQAARTSSYASWDVRIYTHHLAASMNVGKTVVSCAMWSAFISPTGIPVPLTQTHEYSDLNREICLAMQEDAMMEDLP